MALLFKDVYAVVKLIPRGMVMSYGGVARQCGYPRAARQVGYALHALTEAHKVPWWRVVNSQGRISNNHSPDAPERQRERLQAEGVVVNATFRLDLRVYDGEMLVFEKLHRRRVRATARTAAQGAVSKTVRVGSGSPRSTGRTKGRTQPGP